MLRDSLLIQLWHTSVWHCHKLEHPGVSGYIVIKSELDVHGGGRVYGFRSSVELDLLDEFGE